MIGPRRYLLPLPRNLVERSGGVTGCGALVVMRSGMGRARAGPIKGRAPTGEDGVRPFQLGAFKAAVATGAPILPVSLAGTRRFLRDGTHLPRPTSVTITLSAPIYPNTAANPANSADSSDWHELIRLRDATRAAIVRYAGEPLL